MPVAVCWFRRDLRLGDHPALVDAASHGDVLALYVLDPRLLASSGAPRLAYLRRSLLALDEALGGRLTVRVGDPVAVLAEVVADVDAVGVWCSADFGPYGHRRDAAVEAALAAARPGGVPLHRVGSPYAVDPGTVRTGGGTPYRVFTPFLRAWKAHGTPPPSGVPADLAVVAPPSAPDAAGAVLDRHLPEPDGLAAVLPPAGELAALERLDAFLADGAARYHEQRDLPGVEGTSRLSAALRWGCLHPRTVLARLRVDLEGHEVLRSELAWREFYADVLWHRPASAWEALHPQLARLRRDEGALADERFAAWAEGRTGYPIVDAGMRQLLAEGWMHNRVRMIVASFLVKDLHLPWQRGARHFFEHLVDGDLASNAHGWQWVAGTGTDAAPFFRIFNPVAQGERFDPDGAYVRRWVPELAHLPTRDVHAPWKGRGGVPLGYVPPVVDHAVERLEALRRYDEVRSG